MKKQAFNPYLPTWEYIPDGEPYVFGDFVYIYGFYDKFNGKPFCIPNIAKIPLMQFGIRGISISC